MRGVRGVMTADDRCVILNGVTESGDRSGVMTMAEPTHPPSTKAPLAWALTGAVPWLVLAAGQLVWFTIDPRHSPASGWYPQWLHGLAAAVTVFGALVSVVVAPLWRYRVHRWDISPQAVYTRTGWLVQERRIAPISRLQTVDTYRGPLDRMLGLANVTVTTASSAGAVHIVALDTDIADRIVAQLTDIAALAAEDAT
jgi:membrane protein YdbS with pleckstrin-like domain